MIIVDIIKNEKSITGESVYTLRGTTHLKRRVIPIMTLLHSSTRTTRGSRKAIPTAKPSNYNQYIPIYPRALLQGRAGTHTTSIVKWGVVACCI